MTTPYAMVPQPLPLEALLNRYLPPPPSTMTPGSAMAAPPGPAARLPGWGSLRAFGAGLVSPLGAPEPTYQIQDVPSLSGQETLPTPVASADLGAAAAEDPAAAFIGQSIGLGPAFRLAGAGARAIAASPPAQWLGRQLTRPPVGAPLALGGALATTTAETQQPAPSAVTPISRAEYDRQNRRLGAAQTLSDVVKAAEESVRGSDAYAALVENRQATAARRMMEQAVAAATARWNADSERRPALEKAEEERLEQGYQRYLADLRTQHEDAIKAHDARERELLNRPFQERYPTVSSALPWVSAALGGVISGAARARNVGRFNAETGNIGGRWQAALDDVATAPTAAARDQAITTAQGLERAAGALERRGPRHSMEYAPAIGLAEGAQLLPSVVDYAASTPGSPLRRHVTESMSDPWSVGGRLAQGAGWGLAAAKIGQGTSHTMLPRQGPPTLGPATTAAAQRYGVPSLPAEPAQQSLLDRLLGRPAQAVTPPPPQPLPSAGPPSPGGQSTGTPYPLLPQRLSPEPNVSFGPQQYSLGSTRVTPQQAPPPPPPPPPTGPFERGVTRFRNPETGEVRELDAHGRWRGPRPGGGHGWTTAPPATWQRISAAPLGLAAAIG